MKGTTGRIIGNTFWLVLQRVGARILTFLLMIYLARGLGSLGFGKFTFATSFALLFLVLCDMGLTTLTIREVARAKEKGPDYVGSTAVLKFFLSILAFLVISVALAFMDMPQDTRIAAYFISACIILENMGAFFGGIFNAYEDMKYVTIIEIVQKLFLVAACLTALRQGSGLITVCFIYFLSGVLCLILNMWFVYRKFLRPRYHIDMGFWKASLKESVPLAIVAVISMIYYHTDIVMLGKMKGEEVAGWYGVSYHIFFALATIPGAFLTAAFPAMSRFFKESQEKLKEAYRRSFKVMLGVGLPVSVGTFLLSDRIILSLFGAQYHHSARALKIFSLIIIFSYMNSLAGYFLTSINKQRLTAKILVLTTGINIALNFILIPRFSYMGAVYATVFSEILFFTVFLMFLPGDFRSLPAAEFFGSLISSAIMAASIYIMAKKDLAFSLIIIAAIAVYSVSIWVTGFLTKAEKDGIKNVFLKKMN